ncbi:MAG: hypothetical protein ACO1OB_01660 [Archangium sp.]
MNRALVLGSLLLLSCEKTPPADVPWPKELSTATSLTIAWEDLEGPPVTKTITGGDVKKIQARFSPDAQGGTFKCAYHRDASFTLPSGKKVDLCFGCGIAIAGNGKEFGFDAAKLRASYIELLGPQPPQKNPFAPGL